VVLDTPYVLVEDACTSDEAHRYAWVFHAYGSLAVRTNGVQSSRFKVQGGGWSSGTSQAAQASGLPALPDDGVWRWLTNRRGGVTDTALCADWRIRDGLWLRAWVQSDGAMEWTAGQTPGNPMPDRRGTLVLRVAGTRGRFRAAFEIHHGAPRLSALPAERFERTPLGEEERDK
jgi:hypothetical protein